jgi:hypothetical protein
MVRSTGAATMNRRYRDLCLAAIAAPLAVAATVNGQLLAALALAALALDSARRASA